METQQPVVTFQRIATRSRPEGLVHVLKKRSVASDAATAMCGRVAHAVRLTPGKGATCAECILRTIGQ